MKYHFDMKPEEAQIALMQDVSVLQALLVRACPLIQTAVKKGAIDREEVSRWLDDILPFVQTGPIQ